MSRQPLSKDIRDKVFERDNYRCQNCGVEYQQDERGKTSLQLHHITPLGEGGDQSIDNLITVCADCRFKFDRDELRKKFLYSLDRTYEATDHAQKIESFGDDSIEIIKINLLVASIAIPAISLMSQFTVSDISSFNNEYTQISAAFWFLSIVFAEVTYILCRRSGASLSAIRAIMEEERTSESSSVINENKRVYKRNVALVAGSILLTTVAILSFVVGTADAVGLL